MKRILPVIVISQFFCTSVWFAVNAVLPDLSANLKVPPAFLVHLTSAVQFGFIAGTLLFAVLAFADRFSPSSLFFFSAVLASLSNVGMTIPNLPPGSLLLSRFLTGFFLAGIYPVGMKIASDHFAAGLGKSLGWLVGALVLGTALPHLLKSLTLNLDWRSVAFTTSGLALAGGLLMRMFVPDGPHRKQSVGWTTKGMTSAFASAKFRGAALGYFGHMWELYAFWTFVPVILSRGVEAVPGTGLEVATWSFIIIAAGGAACILGGLLAQKIGALGVAAMALTLSGVCCLLSPVVFKTGSMTVLLIFMVCWGMVVVADSPLFSTLVAQNAPAIARGTSLTIVNCIGFTITIVSIQLLNLLSRHISFDYLFLVLFPGPLLGVTALLRNR